MKKLILLSILFIVGCDTNNPTSVMMELCKLLKVIYEGMNFREN